MHERVGAQEPGNETELRIALQEVWENKLTMERINSEIGRLSHVMAHCLISDGNNNYQG
ncbi:hypothetical protein L873DRAFT_232784 [Choiromyces venosus 120613-1]|uniref:Uncharacterized protein n=1 Tax=Choiromyces venosus 120613-1 TaxID=1336337 RepID=A0A3N4K1E1_9PEZI|nr:hypothetical protein L873DRAFT_232784 [Choiromyces venosus 120613-1]